MTIRSKRAPDLVSSGSQGSLLSAASSRVCNKLVASGRVTVHSGHLGEKRRRPPPTAPHLVPRDSAVRDFEDMSLVRRVGNAIFLPPEREFHQLSGGQWH